MPRKLRPAPGGTDCLFIHAGRYSRGRRDILLVPLGTFALADRLRRLGFSARILDAALLPDPLAGAAAAAARRRPALLCLDLHWHQQSAAVHALCRELRRRLPGIPIVLGGYTASFFAEEVLKEFPCADYVIKGDAETALPSLLGAVLAGKAPGNIPNLYRREGGTVVPPSAIRPAAPRDMAAGSSTCYSGLINRRDYLGLGREVSLGPAGPGGGPRREATAYLCVGRGCFGACSYCGGGADAQRLINSRRSSAFRPATALMDELKALRKDGIKRLYVSYDPPGADRYYSRLFAAMRRAGLRFSAVFECWRLPSEKFVKDFAATFGKGSKLSISPDCGSARVRALNGRGTYSNADLEAAALAVAGAGLELQLDFTSGLPFETRRDFAATLSLIRRLREKVRFRLSAGAIEIEPCSPVFLRPGRYGVTLSRRTFRDFLAASRKGRALGYRTRAFSEADILANVGGLRRLAGGR